jgi:hypothetical protein
VRTFKFRHHTLGGHVHVAVFVAKEPNQTFAKSGDLVFNAGQEFRDFKDIVLDAAAVIFEDRATPHPQDYTP